MQPLRFLPGPDGFVSTIELQRMELGEPDASGRRRPIPVQDSEFAIPCDVAVTAIGTRANPFAKLCADVELNRWGLIETDENGRTSNPKVWAGGDIVTVPRPSSSPWVPAKRLLPTSRRRSSAKSNHVN